jgi:hypothetical protein
MFNHFAICQPICWRINETGAHKHGHCPCSRPLYKRNGDTSAWQRLQYTSDRMTLITSPCAAAGQLLWRQQPQLLPRQLFHHPPRQVPPAPSQRPSQAAGCLTPRLQATVPPLAHDLSSACSTTKCSPSAHRLCDQKLEAAWRCALIALRPSRRGSIFWQLLCASYTVHGE